MPIVYDFTVYDITTDQTVKQPSKRTEEQIESIQGATLVDGTAEEVDEADLDEDGRYISKKDNTTD